MERKITTLLCALLLLGITGCGSPLEKVNIAVWKKPEFTLPTRPVLISNGAGTDGEIVRKSGIDMLNMIKYSRQLETLLFTIKNQVDTAPPLQIISPVTSEKQ